MLKAFLDSILYEADPDGLLPRKRAILREYLETQKTSGKGDSDVTFLPSFFQAWGFAAETNFDMLLSQVTASLALLLKACASSADLLEYGTLLSKQVLQTSVAKRLNRSLSAPASKENVISPILRLLTEITRFNEGALAKAVYAKRDFTLDARILARNIGLWRDDKDVPVEKRKPSIRTHAVRYFLTHMTYQDELAKTEILSNTNVVRGVFDHIHADSPSLISEIFSTMKDHVFADKAIMRHTKSRILTGKTLSHIASLYRYETSEESVHPGRKAPDEMAHEFLMFVCTSPAYGVMLPSNGYYPPANEDEDGDAILEDAADFANGVTADAVEGTDRVRNIILGEFVQSLRPHASIMQTELIIAIFEACPELVAPYFRQKEAFSYDPKLTSTWIGYSSFLYKVVELPVPQRFGGRRSYKDMPPPVSVVMQSILPQPLTQAVLVKCLNNSSELVNLFAIRILIVAFKKLRDVLEEYATASATRSSQAWEHGGKRLLAEFSQRCPTIKTVIQAYRRPTFQKDMMREAIVRLMRMYFEVTPQVALEEKFDVSVPLCNTLIQAGKPAEAPEEKAFRVLELEHWMQIARQSSSMRWWQKTSKLQTLLHYLPN
jgi:nucleolar pre-ribosomal-associated protein 1